MVSTQKVTCHSDAAEEGHWCAGTAEESVFTNLGHHLLTDFSVHGQHTKPSLCSFEITNPVGVAST
jgi:hypothetical protein